MSFIKVNESAILNKILWLWRFYGILDFEVASFIIQTCLQLLKSEHLSKDEKIKCIKIASSVIRQLLALYPMNADILRTFVKISSLYSFESFDVLWIHSLKRLLNRNENFFWMEEKNRILMECGDNIYRLSEILKNTLNPLILYEGVLKIWKSGEWKLCVNPLERLMKTPFSPFVAALLGFAALGAGDVELAERLADKAIHYFLRSNLMAEIFLVKGNRERARTWWIDSLRREPFQSWIYYRLWELEQSFPSEAILKGKKIFIFLYTFNKKEETLKTISSLVSSKIGASHIVIMNNGSTNFSPEDFDRSVKAATKGFPVSIINLPVNIGAPAARNWLWHLPEARDADYIAYLDDDVILPENWLPCYIQDLELFPDVVVVGPKVLNPGSVKTIQYIYRFFDEIGERKIRFTPTAPFLLDLGQYSFRRPCLSVMGCCHLFHRKRWEKLEIPGFDIRFSPSQVDDLEHDIQIWKHGGTVLYDGRVEVKHLQNAGRALARSRASWAHVWGNHMKMEAKFSGDELYKIDNVVKEKDDTFFRVICGSRREGAVFYE